MTRYAKSLCLSATASGGIGDVVLLGMNLQNRAGASLLMATAAAHGEELKHLKNTDFWAGLYYKSLVTVTRP